MKKVALIVACSFVFSGCKKQSYDISYMSKLVLDYNSNASPLECITKIGGKKINKSNISGDGKKLTVGNMIIRWSGDFTTKEKGLYSVTFSTNIADKLQEEKSIVVADISAPKIDAKESISLSADQLKTVDPETLFVVTDNSREEVTVSTEYEKNPASTGTYPMLITAIDSSGNIAKKEIMLHVTVPKDSSEEKKEEKKTEKKKTEEKKTEENKPKKEAQNSSVTKTSEDKKKKKKQTQESKKASAKKKKISSKKKSSKKTTARRATASSRTFSFSSSSNMTATYHKALAYAQSQMASGRANSYSVTPIKGSDGTYIGYRVTFG